MEARDKRRTIHGLWSDYQNALLTIYACATKCRGRHSAYGFTMWMAGGGIKGGVSVGQTDELGAAATEDPFKVKNLHATMLQQMGLPPNRLTYFYGGLNQKLVGVEGAEPIHQII